MKKILFIGGSGFIGRNTIPYLAQEYDVVAPSRQECNLVDEKSVEDFLQKNSFSTIIHCASAHSSTYVLDNKTHFFSNLLRSYYNIAKHADKFERIFYFGSGAEYAKQYPIINISEDSIGVRIPQDEYGFAKYIINQDIIKSKNIYNMRIFGCYGPTDAKTKFIRDCIDACLEKRDITIRQNCMFDYIFVSDIANILSHFIKNKPLFHDYNVTTGIGIDLLTIAQRVKNLMNSSSSIVIYKEGWNNEYTSSNKRLLAEIGDYNFTSLDQGILRQIEWQKTL